MSKNTPTGWTFWLWWIATSTVSWTVAFPVVETVTSPVLRAVDAPMILPVSEMMSEIVDMAALFGEWFALTNTKPLSPERITPIDVREYRSHLLVVKNYKPATVNRKLASLSTFCEWAREAGLIPANPVRGISLVEEVRPAPKWLDKRAQYALLRAVQERGKTRDIALITLMLHSGLRVSEVSNLRVGDIRMSARKGSVRVRGGKGEKFRTVPLNVDARKAVQAHLEALGEIEGDRWLFMGKRGGQLKSSGIRYLVQRYAYDARLEEVTPHTLRHTFGKNLVDAGVPLDRVASLLGHESVDTTRIYTTPSQQDLQREVEKVAMVWRGRGYQNTSGAGKGS